MPTRRDILAASTAALVTATLPFRAALAQDQATAVPAEPEGFQLDPRFQPQVVRIKKNFLPGHS